MKNKIDAKQVNTKQVTIQTLVTLKQNIYARAAKRARELSQAGGDLKALAAKLQAVQKRADFEAGRIAYAIQLVRVRA